MNIYPEELIKFHSVERSPYPFIIRSLDLLVVLVLVGAVLVGGGERRGGMTLEMGGNPPHPLVWVDEVEG